MSMKNSKRTSRRQLLKIGAAAMGGGLLAQQKALAIETPGNLGTPLGPYGDRSPFEKALRYRRDSKTPETGSSFTPLQDSHGTITPSALHYERHHAGIPLIDPAQHRLVIHGMVERPLSLSVAEIKRLPSITRVMVLECGGNSGSEWAATTGPDVQRSFGLVSCSEWTGVPLSLLLKEVGVQKGASWVVSEGAEEVKGAGSIPLAKAMDDCIVAYGQNGEALRPQNGFPVRLIVPGFEGIYNTKWLRRMKVVDRYYMTYNDYGHISNDPKVAALTFQWGPKSVITSPSGGQKLPGHGMYQLTGLAWSGGGAVRKVEVSSDGGHTWKEAEIRSQVHRMAHTRFGMTWRWEGQECVLQSRCTDELGQVQPTREQLAKFFNRPADYYHTHGVQGTDNMIQPWKIAADGSVSNAIA